MVRFWKPAVRARCCTRGAAATWKFSFTLAGIGSLAVVHEVVVDGDLLAAVEHLADAGREALVVVRLLGRGELGQLFAERLARARAGHARADVHDRRGLAAERRRAHDQVLAVRGHRGLDAVDRVGVVRAARQPQRLAPADVLARLDQRAQGLDLKAALGRVELELRVRDLARRSAPAYWLARLGGAPSGQEQMPVTNSRRERMTGLSSCTG